MADDRKCRSRPLASPGSRGSPLPTGCCRGPCGLGEAEAGCARPGRAQARAARLPAQVPYRRLVPSDGSAHACLGRARGPWEHIPPSSLPEPPAWAGPGGAALTPSRAPGGSPPKKAECVRAQDSSPVRAVEKEPRAVRQAASRRRRGRLRGLVLAGTGTRCSWRERRRRSSHARPTSTGSGAAGGGRLRESSPNRPARWPRPRWGRPAWRQHRGGGTRSPTGLPAARAGACGSRGARVPEWGGGPVSRHRVTLRPPVPACPVDASVRPLGGGQPPGVDLHALRLRRQRAGPQGGGAPVSEAGGPRGWGLATDRCRRPWARGRGQAGPWPDAGSLAAPRLCCPQASGPRRAATVPGACPAHSSAGPCVPMGPLTGERTRDPVSVFRLQSGTSVAVRVPDRNTEQRNHCLDPAGIKNYTSKFGPAKAPGGRPSEHRPRPQVLGPWDAGLQHRVQVCVGRCQVGASPRAPCQRGPAGSGQALTPPSSPACALHRSQGLADHALPDGSPSCGSRRGSSSGPQRARAGRLGARRGQARRGQAREGLQPLPASCPPPAP